MIDIEERFDTAEEFKAFIRAIMPQGIYDDVETLQQQMQEVLNIINNLGNDFVPESAVNINDMDLNNCIGKVIFAYGNNCLNRPNGSNGYLINIPHNSSPDKFNKQIWITRPTDNIFVRNMDGGVFTNWTPIRFDTGWAKLTLASGISEQNNSQYPCRYRKINNQVYVDGCVKGITAINTVVATLPEGYRPSKSYYFQSASNGGHTDTFRVHTDGRIELLFATGAVSAGSYHFITTSFLND